MKFKIQKIHCDTENLKEVKELLYHLEQHSSHPIAKSIVKELEGKTDSIQLNDIQEHKGKGIEGKWNNNHYYLGSYNIAQELTKDSSHSLYLLKNNQLFAKIDIEDEVKPNTQEVHNNLTQNRHDTNNAYINGTHSLLSHRPPDGPGPSPPSLYDVPNSCSLCFTAQTHISMNKL